MKRISVLVLLSTLVLAGCAKKYITPGAGVDVAAVSNASIREAMEAEPAADFPARIATVRVQGSGYRSYSARGYGSGKMSIVTTRDIESEEDLVRLERLPQVAAIAPLNKLVVPSDLESTTQLREAAAGLKADVLLMYSIDTGFWVDKKNIGPLAMMSLGFAPKNRAYVTSTASAALVDIRTGFIYGLAEGSARADKKAHSWNKEAVVERVRLETESDAFRDMVGQIESLWADLLVEHGAAGRAAAR